jgi:hypothetical protein
LEATVHAIVTFSELTTLSLRDQHLAWLEATWLEAISRTEGRAIDLGTVPGRYWDEIADLGCDGVWLMGVWQRSPAGIGIALTNDDVRLSFDAALPDSQPYDVVGSPYCLRGYVSMIISVDEARSPPLGRRWRRVGWA